MKPRISRRICAQHAYWLLEKRKTVRVSTPNLFRGSARKDSAVRVSLSSYHNIKEPVAEQPKPHSRTHNGSKSPIESQRQPRCLPSRTRAFPASVRWIARSRIVPQEVGSTRANWVSRDYAGRCQGLGNSLWTVILLVYPCLSGHIPARIRRHYRVVNGVVTIRCEYG